MRALVIEDNIYESELLSGILTESGFEVTCTGLLEDAIATLSECAFDIIMLDLRLRDSSPETTLNRMGEIDSASGGSPIIVVTGYASAMPKSLHPAIASCIFKPYATDDILIAVGRTLFSRKKKDV